MCRFTSSVAVFFLLGLTACDLSTGSEIGSDAEFDSDDADGTDAAADSDTDAAADSDTDAGADTDTDANDSQCTAPITSIPAGLSTAWPNIYTFTRYLKIGKYNIHVLGTASVSDWMMRESCMFIERVVLLIKNPEDRERMSGHKAYLATFRDPPISADGQRNGGGLMLSLFCEEMVCDEKADPLYPDRPVFYRHWQVPAHELGHSIENNLGLRDRSDEVYSTHVPNWESSMKREHFAWATTKWFGQNIDGTDREDMRVKRPWEYEYFSTIFDADDQWEPVCTR